MHSTLSRQLRRLWGVATPEALDRLCDSARDASNLDTLDPQLRAALAGLHGLLTKVDATYDQFDRDLQLRTLSLEQPSSQDLIASNNRLAADLAIRTRAIASLQSLCSRLRKPAPRFRWRCSATTPTTWKRSQRRFHRSSKHCMRNAQSCAT